MAPSTPPPPRSVEFAAFTTQSTSSSVMSPNTACKVMGTSTTLSPSASLGTELGYDFDLANDGFVERSEVLSRNPVLQVIFPPCFLDLIAIQKRFGDEKARDVSPAAGGHVPVTRYLHRVGFAQHWIKDRLFRQSAWKGAHPGLSYQSSSFGPTGRHKVTAAISVIQAPLSRC